MSVTGDMNMRVQELSPVKSADILKHLERESFILNAPPNNSLTRSANSAAFINIRANKIGLLAP